TRGRHELEVDALAVRPRPAGVAPRLAARVDLVARSVEVAGCLGRVVGSLGIGRGVLGELGAEVLPAVERNDGRTGGDGVDDLLAVDRLEHRLAELLVRHRTA